MLTTAAQALPASLRSTFLPALLSALTECVAWHVPAVPATEKAPLRSTIPTLLLAGQIDPLTAPANAALIARGLPRSITLTFPHTGHGVTGTGPCPARIIAAFLDHPSTKPDTGCIAGMRRFQFMGTGSSGSRGVGRDTEAPSPWSPM
jgi:pimeloyl-ACP methyl ester carboxylesterase